MDATIIGDAMSQMMSFPLITYVPLQVAAILMMQHWSLRIAAAFPLIPMLPVIYTGFDPDSYGNGSLYGVGLYFVYIPAMVYLAIFCLIRFAITLVQENRASPVESTEDEQCADGQTEATSPAAVLLALVVVAVIIIFIMMLLVPFG